MNYTLFSEVLRGRFKFLICFQNTCTGALCTSCYTDGRCHGQTSVWGTTSKRFSHTVAIVLFTSIALLKCSQIYCAMAPLVTPLILQESVARNRVSSHRFYYFYQSCHKQSTTYILFNPFNFVPGDSCG